MTSDFNEVEKEKHKLESKHQNEIEGSAIVNDSTEILNKGIGTKEFQTLNPAKCLIEDAFVVAVGEKKKARKVMFVLKHPARADPIKVSSVIVMREKGNKRELIELGTWVNTDSDNPKRDINQRAGE
ncbi:MAG: hypothetical protein AABY22_14315, partial [Nanoarchaeota archaeon]